MLPSLGVNFGRDFFGEPETLKKNKAEKFAEKFSRKKSPAIFREFARPK